MSEIAVQFATRFIERQWSTAIGKSLLKTLTEPITNSDDSYRRIIESSENGEGVYPISISIDRTNRLVRIIDQAQGMTTEELENKFREYGAAKSGAYEGYSSRGIFGQGISDVLFYHNDGKIKSIKNGQASICSFYKKNRRPYISVEKKSGSVEKIAKEWGIKAEHGTVIEFVANETTTIHDYDNLVKKLGVFYMLRMINANDRRAINLIYKEKKGVKESLIRYEFPRGDLVQQKKFTFKFENYAPVEIDIELYKAHSPLETIGDDRENGLLVYDEKEAVYDQTFFGLENLRGADKFFGFMKLTGAREIILDKINASKNPEAILTDSRDGFDKQHDFYKKLSSQVRDWLYPFLNEEGSKKTNEGVSENTIEKHRQAFEELNKLYTQLTGEDTNGTIKIKKKSRPIGGLEFARGNITITVGKRYGLQLMIDTRIIKPGNKILLKSLKGKVGFAPMEFEVVEPAQDSDEISIKTITLTGNKAATADTIEASIGKRTTSVVVSVVSEEIIYPKDGIVFNPEYVRTSANRDSTLHLYVDLEKIKPGEKVTFSSSNDSINLKKLKVVVPKRMRTTNTVAKIELPFIGLKNEETSIIEARVGNYFTQCRVDIKDSRKVQSTGPIGKFRDWDFDESVPKHLQTTYDPMEGSPTQGYILINSNHPINKHYFGDEPQKKEVEKSHKAQLYLAELILNESLGGMVNEAYQKGVIPQNYGPGIDIPVYVAQKKFDLGPIIYDLFVEPEATVRATKRAERFETAMQEKVMNEAELLFGMADRQRKMVEMYFGLGEQRPHTLEEIASESGITRERVRQIINQALAPVRPAEEYGVETLEEDKRDYILEEEMKMKSKVDQIISRTASMYKLKPEDLKEETRRKNIVIPRQIVMYLLRTSLGLSYPSIGKMFERDHTTVIHACGRIKELMSKDKRIWQRVSKIQHDVDSAEIPSTTVSEIARN